MGLTDAKTWDEAAVFVIAELGSLKKRIKELEGLEAAPTNGERRLAVLEERNQEADSAFVDFMERHARLATKVERVSGDVAEICGRLEDLEFNLSAPDQLTETSQCMGCKDPNCSNKAKVAEQKQTEAGQVATLQKMLAESEARTTEKLVELHAADLVNKTLESRVLALEDRVKTESQARWLNFHAVSRENDRTRAAKVYAAAAEAKVTELEVERNLAKARISAITDKLRSLVTQLRVQNTTAPHWRSDTAVGAYRHSANLLETALIELALVAPTPVADPTAAAVAANHADKDGHETVFFVHGYPAAKEHAERLARMLEASTPVQVGTPHDPTDYQHNPDDDSIPF